MPRPRSASRPAVAAAALAVIDRDGLAALSMRAVAGELGMGTMSLYRYVQDREQLEGLVVELVLSGIDTEPPAGAAWPTRVTALVVRVYEAVRAHPSVVPLLLTHRHAAIGSTRWAEAVLGVLTEAGFTGRQRVIAFRGLLSYLLGALQTQHFGPLSGAGTDALAELPSTEYPHLAETARTARRVQPDEEFRGGLTIVLRGLGQPDE